MKTLTLTLTALCLTASFLRADEVALITIRNGKEKALERVAIEFNEADAPAHTASFKKLANKGFYNGLAIHRSFPHLLVQMGDPLTKSKDRMKVGTGGPNFTLPPEIHGKHVTGAIAAARLPDKINPSRRSNGSQFYVCLAPMPTFDGQYTVFGRVIYGLDALDALSTKPVDSNDYPIDRLEIQSIKVMPREKLPPAPLPPAPNAPAKPKRWYQIF